MRCVLHIGMPKSGSTSVQLALWEKQDFFANELGISRSFSRSDFANDHHLYQCIVSNDFSAIDRYIDNSVEQARLIGSDIIVFSSEMLFTLPISDPGFQYLLNRLTATFSACKIIAIVRDLRRFLRSYLVQLIDNGSLLLEDDQLAVWVVNQLYSFWQLPLEVVAISFDRSIADEMLLSRFFSEVGGRLVIVDERHENETQQRSLMFTSLRGVASRFYSARNSCDINSPATDLIRDSVSTFYDNYIDSSDNPALLLSALDILSKIADEQMMLYIDHCIALAPDDRRMLYDECVSRALCRNISTRNVSADSGEHDVG